MSDDLSAFFAKKKDKKKKSIVKVDDVGQMLERKAKRQEERDREEAEEDKRVEAEEAFMKRNAAEESEWLEYNDTMGNRLEGLKIRDMALDEVEEEVIDEDEESAAPVVPTKTWGTVEKKTEAEVMPEVEGVVAAARGSSRYVPPTQRFTTTSAARVDLTNQEMFPTFAAADQIEKIKDANKKSAWGSPAPAATTYSAPRGGSSAAWGPPPSAARDSGRDREAAMAAARAMMNSGPPAPRPAAPAPAAAEPKKNAYVPPALRNRT